MSRPTDMQAAGRRAQAAAAGLPGDERNTTAGASVLTVRDLASMVKGLLLPLRPFHSLRVSLSPIGGMCIERECDDILAHFGDAYFIGRQQWDPTPRFLQIRRGAQAGSWRTHARQVAVAAEFRDRFMRPEGWDDYAELYFWHRGNFEASICIRRGIGHPAFSPGELRLLKRLHGRLRSAIRQLARTLEEQHEHRCLRLLVARLPVPVMLLDESLAPIILNPPAHRQCLAWMLGPGSGRHLKLPSRVPVHPAIMEACGVLQAMGRHGEARPVVHPEHSSLTATVERLRAGPAAPPAFAVWFSESRPPRVDLACRALLTRSEWEVALQVSAGATNREAAGRLGKSVATIRAQLHATFRKLGVRSRMALAARLHSSAGGAAQD